jgi:hypothetical protein
VAKLRRLLLGAVAASSVALGCYSPNISQGGFSCGPGGACPDKFRCVEKNNRCYPSDVDASPDVPVDRPPVCTSVTSIATPVCSTGPASGQQCNPACQLGCGGCGWCGLVGGASKCLTGTEGSLAVGEVCDPTKSMDCKAGLYCQPECAGTTGRCYRFCGDDTGCMVDSADSKCNVAAKKDAATATQFTLCSLVSACTIVPQYGCPAGFGCYPFGIDKTECDCQGTGATGDTCGVNYAPCAPGNLCIGPQGGTATCHQECNTANGNADCPSGGTCNPSGTVVGVCM